MKGLNQGKVANILLFGETGNGKSTLGNYLLGFDAFKVSNDVKAETKVTFGRQGIGDSSDIFIIDTPGLQDTEGADKQHMIQLVQYVKEHKELNAIIVVFNYQQVRFPYNIQTMLKLFCNIFPMKAVGKHIGLVFTNSFTKRGILTSEQKLAKSNKVLPEFRRVIKEASGSDLPVNIPTAFVDMDPEEGIDENGKNDLERLKTWASFLPNLNVEEMKVPEPDVRIETQDFNEIKSEGEYIIKTIIKKEREVYCQLDGTISYGEWVEKERKEEKIINPEIEKIKKLNLDNEQTLKKIQEEQDKKIKELQKINEEIRNKEHKEFLDLLAANKKTEEQMNNFRNMFMDVLKSNKQMMQENQTSKKNGKRKYLEKKLIRIKNNAKNCKEEKTGKCSKGKNEFKAGITEEDEDQLIKQEVLSADESTFDANDWKFLSKQTKTLEKTLTDKIIVGWKLKSDHDDGEGGFWTRNSEVLGTSSYSFTVSTFRTQRCHWSLKIWCVNNSLPYNLDNNDDDDDF